MEKDQSFRSHRLANVQHEHTTFFEDEEFTLTPQSGPITLEPLIFVDDMHNSCKDSRESAAMGKAITTTLNELKMEAHSEKSGLLIFGKNKDKFNNKKKKAT